MQRSRFHHDIDDLLPQPFRYHEDSWFSRHCAGSVREVESLPATMVQGTYVRVNRQILAVRESSSELSIFTDGTQTPSSVEVALVDETWC